MLSRIPILTLLLALSASTVRADETEQNRDSCQVVLEVRLLTVADTLFERIGIDFNVKPGSEAEPPTPGAPALKRGLDLDLRSTAHAFLDREQLAQLME